MSNVRTFFYEDFSGVSGAISMAASSRLYLGMEEIGGSLEVFGLARCAWRAVTLPHHAHPEFDSFES